MNRLQPRIPTASALGVCQYNSIFQDNLSDCENQDLSGVVFAIVEYELNTSKSENELNTSKRKSKPFSKDY